MEPTQNFTEITPQQQAWVDFCATGGISVDEEGNPVKIAAEKLAHQIGVERRTLYNWKLSIPRFNERVISRRRDIFAQSRMSRVYNAMYVKAVKGDVAAATLLMKQSGLLIPDRQEIKQVINIDAAIDSLIS